MRAMKIFRSRGLFQRAKPVITSAEKLTYYAVNSEYERSGQEVGCGTATAQIIYDLGPGQLAAT